MAAGTDNVVPGTFVQAHFLAPIGLVMVQHAQMDVKLQNAIIHLSGMDINSGYSVLSKVQMTNARVEIFQNLARTKAETIERLAKMLALADEMREICDDRNIIAHSTPYAYSPKNDEAIYFRDVNKTAPQIKIQPPYRASPATLIALAGRFMQAATWLNMLLPLWKKDGVDDPFLPENCTCHPHWNDDAQFPWQDKYLDKLKAESRKPQNAHLRPKRPRSTSPE